MKYGILTFAAIAGAFVIPDIPDQVPLYIPPKTTAEHGASTHKDDTAHNHNDASWLKFLPGKNTLVGAYDDVVDYMTAGVDSAANAFHDWVDKAIAHGVHGHDDDDDDGDDSDDDNDDDEDYSSRTIYEIINDNEYTTRFAKLVNDRPHLVELLNSTKTNSTLFVPIDKAFKHIPDDDKHKPSKEFIDDVLLYHVGLGSFPVHKVLDTHTFPTALKEKKLGGEPQRLRIRVGFTGVRVNFYSKVLKAAEAKNGIIAGIDSILLPPPTVSRELALFPDRFSTLLLAYDKTDFADVVHKLHINGSTVFAPSNHAFSRLGPRANAFLFNTQTGLRYLRAILKYHIVPNVTLYSDALYDESTGASSHLNAEQAKHFDLKTLLDDAHLGVDIGKSWGFITIRVNGFTSVAIQDGIAKDGVIHVVEKVLLPPHRHEHNHGSVGDNDDKDISVDDLKRRLKDYVEEE